MSASGTCWPVSRPALDPFPPGTAERVQQAPGARPAEVLQAAPDVARIMRLMRRIPSDQPGDPIVPAALGGASGLIAHLGHGQPEDDAHLLDVGLGAVAQQGGHLVDPFLAGPAEHVEETGVGIGETGQSLPDVAEVETGHLPHALRQHREGVRCPAVASGLSHQSKVRPRRWAGQPGAVHSHTLGRYGAVV